MCLFLLPADGRNLTFWQTFANIMLLVILSSVFGFFWPKMISAGLNEIH